VPAAPPGRRAAAPVHRRSAERAAGPGWAAPLGRAGAPGHHRSGETAGWPGPEGALVHRRSAERLDMSPVSLATRRRVRMAAARQQAPAFPTRAKTTTPAEPPARRARRVRREPPAIAPEVSARVAGQRWRSQKRASDSRAAEAMHSAKPWRSETVECSLAPRMRPAGWGESMRFQAPVLRTRISSSSHRTAERYRAMRKELALIARVRMHSWPEPSTECRQNGFSPGPARTGSGVPLSLRRKARPGRR